MANPYNALAKDRHCPDIVRTSIAVMTAFSI